MVGVLEFRPAIGGLGERVGAAGDAVDAGLFEELHVPLDKDAWVLAILVVSATEEVAVVDHENWQGGEPVDWFSVHPCPGAFEGGHAWMMWEECGFRQQEIAGSKRSLGTRKNHLRRRQGLV